MRIIPLASIANQSFTLTLDGVRWSLRLNAGRGVMSASVSRDGSTLITGVRVLAGEPIIPYAHLQTGNFIFVVNDDDLPDYQLFNVSQVLVYLSAAEIAAVQPLTYGEIVATSSQVGYLTDADGFYLTTDTGELLTDD